MILKKLVDAGIDFLQLEITKSDVVRSNFSPALNILQQLTLDKDTIVQFRERVDISFSGFNANVEELWEIPEVRNYVQELDNKFPFWLYFMSKNGQGLLVVLRCFLLPYIKPEAEVAINGPKLQNYLLNRGFPAMNQLCDLVQLSDEENIEMSNRVFEYLKSFSNIREC